MKVLVTGGTGFIGSHVIDCLVSRGITVTIFDRHSGVWQGSKDGVRAFLGEVTNESAVLHAVSMQDGVIHLAGMLGTQETISEPKLAVETNIIGSLNVFKAVHKYDVPAVYIGVGNYWMDNPYSITKATAERFAFMYNREMKTRIAIVRGFNAFGPRQKQSPVRKLVPNLVIPALKHEPISIYGDGFQVMDMIYVKDLAEILVRALLCRHLVYDEIIEAGTGNETTVNYLAELVLKLTGSRSTIRHLPMRPGEVPRAIVKANPANWNLEKIGWRSDLFTPLENALEETISWYKQHIREATNDNYSAAPVLRVAT